MIASWRMGRAERQGKGFTAPKPHEMCVGRDNYGNNFARCVGIKEPISSIDGWSLSETDRFILQLISGQPPPTPPSTTNIKKNRAQVF